MILLLCLSYNSDSKCECPDKYDYFAVGECLPKAKRWPLWQIYWPGLGKNLAFDPSK